MQNAEPKLVIKVMTQSKKSLPYDKNMKKMRMLLKKYQNIEENVKLNSLTKSSGRFTTVKEIGPYEKDFKITHVSS